VGILSAGSIIANQFQLPAGFLIPVLVIGIWMLASLVLWQYGNYNAPHHQMWWEDKGLCCKELKTQLSCAIVEKKCIREINEIDGKPVQVATL
jgi:hypothetical protein